MKTISLPNGMAAFVDDEDFDRVSNYRWHCRTDASTSMLNRHRRHVYVKAHGRGTQAGKCFYLHRLILWIFDARHVDHINGDGLDNRKSNLRVASQHQNGGNARVWDRRKSSVFKGVYFMRRDNKWAAQICLNRINIRLGAYATEHEAAMEYDRAARKHFGEFARTNF